MTSLGFRSTLVLLGAAAATLFTIAYVRSEHPIYFWDWVHHFAIYRAYGAIAATGGIDWLSALVGSIRTDDYNLAVLAPMLPTYLVFGDGRAPYIVTIILLYLLPACWFAARLASRYGAPLPIAWLTALLFWPFWIAALRGMPDVAGLIPLGYATAIVLETRFLTRASIADGIKVGLAVWAAFLLRRWYAYACVSIEATTIAFAAWTVWSVKFDRRAACRCALGALAVNILTVVAGLLMVQLPLVVRILGTRYADAFEAYQKPLAETAQGVFAQTGLLLLAAIVAGLVRAVRSRDTEILFMIVAAVLTSALFLQTQAPSVQHMLPVAFWLFPVAIYGALWPSVATPRWSGPGGAALVLTMLAGWSTVLVPAAHRFLAPAGVLLPAQAYSPLVLQARTDYDALVAGLEDLLRERGGGVAVDPAMPSKVAIFASSAALSGSMLASLAPSLPLATISDVDKRDGLRLAPFKARFAVATEVPALHLPAHSQRVVAVPDRMIAEGIGPGAAYHRVAGPYRLDDGIQASIYRRDRPWTEADAAAMLDALRAYYPDWTIEGDVAH